MYKRGPDNNYNVVDSRQTTALVTDSKKQIPNLSTNGNWIAVVANPYVDLFQLNASRLITKAYSFYFPNTTGWIFPDDTFVALWPDAIRTYEFDGQNWTLIQEEVPQQYTTLVPANIVDFRPILMKVGPNYFTGFTTNSTFVYERHANRSWSLVTNIPTEPILDSAIRHVLYNGFDTIIVSSVLSTSLRIEAARIYTKNNTNGQWTLTQTLYTTELEMNSQGYFPLAAEMMSNSAFVLAAPVDLINDNQTGSLYWYDRDESGSWIYTRRIRSAESASSEVSSFGFAIAPVDNTVLAYQCTLSELSCYLYRAEGCFFEPTNVTCHDQVSPSFCDTNITITDYYTINTRSNCGAVEAHLDGIKATEAGIELALRFTRDGAKDVSCTATKLCDRSASPSTVSVPVAQPHASVVSHGTGTVVPLFVMFCTLAIMTLLL